MPPLAIADVDFLEVLARDKKEMLDACQSLKQTLDEIANQLNIDNKKE